MLSSRGGKIDLPETQAGHGEASHPAPGGQTVTDLLNEAPSSKFHRRTVIISGVGFFTDAYDLFVTGTMVALLTPEWSLSTGQVSLLNSITLEPHVQGPRP